MSVVIVNNVSINYLVMAVPFHFSLLLANEIFAAKLLYYPQVLARLSLLTCDE